MTGKLYGIGVGPGAPDLITIRGWRIITGAPVIAYPAPDTGSSFARSIVAACIREDHIEIPIVVPMRIERFPAADVYDKACMEIASHLDAGRDVAVLCEGDPFFYGSFMHLYERLRHDVPVEVVPAITGMSGAWTATGAPITWGDDILTVLMGTLPEETLTAQMRETDALVVMKIGRNIDKVRRALQASGKYDKAWLVEFATMPNQTVQKLSDAAGKVTPYFSIIVVHGRGRRP